MLEWIAGLILGLPLAAALWISVAMLIGWANGEIHEQLTSRVVRIAFSLSLLAALVLVIARMLGHLPEQVVLGRWLVSGDYQIDLNLLTDGLSLTLTTLSVLVVLIIARFSVNYLHREGGFHRFYLVLSLFAAVIALLVMGGNAVLTFIGWEVSGLCSYLLIAFFIGRPIAAENATRVFITNRVGDAGFLLGIVLSFYWLGSADWHAINADAGGLSALQISILAGCFLLAAIAKSAQVPLVPWLARAMEGPTPSSALFYGAIMVHAGVYLILRLQPLFEQSPIIMAVIAIIGLATALYGFMGGLVQTDVKSALIFSTSGQVGLMFFMAGLGFWQLALIHLCGHALFRGYQFLSAPSILYQLHGERTRPVPESLAQRRGLYAAVLHRFWLEDMANWSVVKPVQRLARALSLFDTAIVDRATGLPAPAVNALSSLAQWEERQLGSGRLLEGKPEVVERDRGVVAQMTEWLAAAFHWFEERLMFRAVGQGMMSAVQQMGQSLSNMERLLGRSWSGIAAAVVILMALIGIGEMIEGGDTQAIQPLGFPVLSALLLIPLGGMFAAYWTKQARAAFALGVAGAAAELILALVILSRFQSHETGMQFVEQVNFFGWHYHLGVDGISILFLPLTALLTLLVMLYAQPQHSSAESKGNIFVAAIFGVQMALIGMFTALNLLQFWVFALAEVIPAAYLIGRWSGHRGRDRAGRQFLQAMLGGLASLFAGILLLGWHTATENGWSFDLSVLLETPLPESQQSLIFILFFLGLAVRLPLFPFHAWLPIAAKHGTVAEAMIFLVGVKVGIYALLRFVFPLLPAAAQQWDSGIVALGLAGMLYGALLAFMQTDLRRLLAFAVISQTGVLVAGLFTLNLSGFRGGLLLSLNLGLAAAGLFMVAGLIHSRLGTTRFLRLGGLFNAAPLLGLTFLVVVLGSIAMPGTPGFEAAHLVLEGALESYGWGIAIVTASGNVLAAGYLLWAYQRIFLAQNSASLLPLTDLRSRELLMAGLLCAVIISVGLYADPWIETISGTVEHMAQPFEAAAINGGHAPLTH